MTSLLRFIQIRQRLVGGWPLRRVIAQHCHFRQLIQTSSGPEKDNVRLSGRTVPYVYDFAYVQTCRIDSVLAGSQNIVADFHFFQPRHVAHLDQTIFGSPH